MIVGGDVSSAGGEQESASVGERPLGALLQERHHREDLEVKVPALETERQQMEVESQSMDEQHRHSTDRQKGKSQNFALVVFSIVRHLTIIHSTGDGAQPFPRGLRLDSGGEGESGGEGQKNH